MRRLLFMVSTGLFAAALLIGVTLTSAPPASAATIAATTACSNGVDNTPGLGLICEVTIDNTITASGGSATVTVRECHGAAGDPEAACTVQTSVLSEPVNAVNQCNDATNGGGGTLRCSVQVTNTFVGVSATPTAVTINQCVGSGDGITIGCDPFPATTTGATITQCNGSANGGTLVGLTCTASGTQALAHAVTINQCNDSTNGGGGLVICSAAITNVEAVATATPAPTASPSGAGAPSSPMPTIPGALTTSVAPSSSPGLPDTSTIGAGNAADATGATLLSALLLAAVLLLGIRSRRNA
jgi:hypothetical protein